MEVCLDESLESSLGGMGRSFLCVSAGTLLPYNHKKTPRGHRTRQGNTELATNCHTFTNGYGSATHLYEPLQRDPPGICEHLYEPARGIQSWHLTATQSQSPPRASTNTFIDPPGELELASDCHTITSPSGICEYLYEPARGTRAGT